MSYTLVATQYNATASHGADFKKDKDKGLPSLAIRLVSSSGDPLADTMMIVWTCFSFYRVFSLQVQLLPVPVVLRSLLLLRFITETWSLFAYCSFYNNGDNILGYIWRDLLCHFLVHQWICECSKLATFSFC